MWAKWFENYEPNCKSGLGVYDKKWGFVLFSRMLVQEGCVDEGLGHIYEEGGIYDAPPWRIKAVSQCV